MTWNPKNKEWYINQGYTYTKFNDHFIIDAEHLHPKSEKRVNVLCDNCGKEYSMTYVRYYDSISKYANNFCKDCAKFRTLHKRQNKHFQKIKSLCDSKNYILLTPKENISNCEDIVEYICPKHGKQITTVEHFCCGYGCRKCGTEYGLSKRHLHTLPQRQSEHYAKVLNICNEKGYTLISTKDDIKNNTSYIEYICPIHGVHQMRVANLLSGKGCPDCANELRNSSYRLSKEELVKRIRKYGSSILNPDEYVNSNVKNLKITCPSCGEIFVTSLSNFTQRNQRCKKCNAIESNGEIKIKKYLEENHITFFQEKRFDDCRDERPLPFDFYLPDNNICIEFDGRQHYEETTFFRDSLENIQKHDKIKTDYCKQKDINLIRISYRDYNNIENILNQKLFLHEDIA